MELFECCGRCRKCKNHCEDYEPETLWYDIKNLWCKITSDIWNKVVEPLSVWTAKRIKRIYKCEVCGRLFAPKYDDRPFSLIVCGWNKIHAPFSRHKYDRYICHHCCSHGFRCNDDPPGYQYTWDEWQDEVEKNNKKLLNTIKERDPEYYNSYVRDKYDWLIEKYGLEG